MNRLRVPDFRREVFGIRVSGLGKVAVAMASAFFRRGLLWPMDGNAEAVGTRIKKPASTRLRTTKIPAQEPLTLTVYGRILS